MTLRGTSFRTRLLLIAAVGLILRLFYVFVLARSVHGIGDWYFFHWGANLLADGHGFIDPLEYVFHGRSLQSAGHPPLWEILLSGVSWLGGTGELAHRAVGCVVGSGTIVLIGLLGRRIGGVRVGLCAAGIAAVYPVLIGADGSLMSESLYGLLVAGAMLLAYRLDERRDVGSAAALGAVIALAGLTRSEGLLLMLLLALPVALRTGSGRWLRLAAAAGACVLVLAPWTIRNAVVFDRFVPVSNNDGTLFAGANCGTTYRGIDVGFWNIKCIPERTLDNEAAQARVWRKLGEDYARDHASRVPAVVGVRLLRTWDFFQPRRMVLYNEGRWVRIEQASLAAYWLLLPFAIGGLVLLIRRRAPLLILLSPILLVTVATAIGYGTPRFRHAAEIPLVLFAAVALTTLAERRLSRAARPSEPAQPATPPASPSPSRALRALTRRSSPR